MKVYITKYCLTKGILERDAIEVEDAITKSPNGMVEVVDKDGSPIRYHEYYHREGDQWHRTLESAQKKANDMRTKKLVALQKQIKKLEKLVF